MSKRYNKFNIAVITTPFNNDIAAEQNLANLIQTLEPLSNKIITITGNFPEYPNKIVEIIRLKSGQTEGKHLAFKMLAHVMVDLQISFNLLKVFKHINIVVFQIGARAYPLSVLLSKFLRKKIVAFSFSTASKLAQIGKGQKALHLANILENFTFLLANQIVVESESVIKFSNMERYRGKISIYGAQYIDTKLFKIKNDLKNKRSLIGYIGRLSPEKGVANFAKAIPLILIERNDLEFLIGGNGSLFDEITNELKSNGTYDKVELTGWIPHEELPEYLNELKLILLPSYSEGLPGIVQEGMACGAIILATPVGAIPDVIKDGETGFIMENNSPECIAKNVIRALEHPNLNEIVKNARKLIEDEYSYELMVRKCKDSLDDLTGVKRIWVR